MLKGLKALGRLLSVLAHVLDGRRTLRKAFPHLSPGERQQAVLAWSRQMLQIMGVELHMMGAVPTAGPMLVVSNHISWLDILVINAVCPAHFVSKSGVRHWPLVGELVSSAGTLFIERESRRDAMRVVHRMAEHLRGNDILAVFPEGTTGDGQTLLPFHANLIQAAIAAEAPVLPGGLSYVDPVHGRRHDAPLFIGDTTLLQSLWNTLRATDVVAVVHYGEPQRAQGRDRRTWAQNLRDAVTALREG